eukprot:3336977-Amphidinium_carterae.1
MGSHCLGDAGQLAVSGMLHPLASLMRFEDMLPSDSDFTMVDLGSCCGFFSLQTAVAFPGAFVVGVEGSVGIGNGTQGVAGSEDQIIATPAIQTHLYGAQRASKGDHRMGDAVMMHVQTSSKPGKKWCALAEPKENLQSHCELPGSKTRLQDISERTLWDGAWK